MLAIERRNEILEKLQTDRRVVVSELSQIYEVSEETIRRDLERLEKEGGWSVEVIDIRSLIPLDKETIYESVKKTSKALIVHEDKVFGGFGGEIAASIGTDLFRYLDAPVQRVGSTFTPVGFNPILESAILPGADRIFEAAKKLLEY